MRQRAAALKTIEEMRDELEDSVEQNFDGKVISLKYAATVLYTAQSE